MPVAAFERFPGRWVALRGSHVVASAATYDELERSDSVEPSDTFFRVPDPSSKFL